MILNTVGELLQNHHHVLPIWDCSKKNSVFIFTVLYSSKVLGWSWHYVSTLHCWVGPSTISLWSFVVHRLSVCFFCFL